MTIRPSRFSAFLAELRRRHVWRVAIAYAAGTFVILQAAEIVLPAFEAPEWGLRVLVVVTLLGFPVAMVLAWVYEITPQGVRRTESVPVQGGRFGSLLPRLALLGLTLITVAASGWWLVKWTVPADLAASRAALDPRSAGGAPAVVASEGAPAVHSLAVLPFENYSEPGEPDYFAAGMHEAVVSQLSQLSSLRVVSRTSVMRFAGTTKSVPEIGRELEVDAVVEGSVLRDGNRVRITVQLIDARTDTHLWSNSYERDFADIIALQSEVAQAIAREIEAEITPPTTTRVASLQSVNPEAHEAYLRGRFEQSKGKPESLERAIQHYREAVGTDSSYAAAYTGLAGAQLLLDISDPERNTELLPAALEAAERALKLDPGSPESRAVLTETVRRIAESADTLEAAIEIRKLPFDSIGMPSEEWLAAFTDFSRQFERVVIDQEHPPRVGVHPHRLVGIARRLDAAGQSAEAVEMLRRLLERAPDLVEAWEALEHIHAVEGEFEQAVAVRAEYLDRTSASAADRAALNELKRAVSEDGGRGYWESRRDELRARAARGETISNVDYAAAAVSLGQFADALDALERAEAQRDRKLYSLPWDPVWDPIRGEPRFRALLETVKRAPPLPPIPVRVRSP